VPPCWVPGISFCALLNTLLITGDKSVSLIDWELRDKTRAALVTSVSSVPQGKSHSMKVKKKISLPPSAQ
jgi:hypothetical protein